MKCGVGRVQCEVLSAKSAAWNAKSAVRSVKCEVVKCDMRTRTSIA